MPDRERALTPEGIQEVRALARRVASVTQTPVVLASPYRRALETAAIAAEAWNSDGEIARSGALTPESAPVEAWEEIRTLRGVGTLLLVGHEPLFSSLTAHILGFPELSIDFNPGTTACVEIVEFGARPRGVLRWLINTKLAMI